MQQVIILISLITWGQPSDSMGKSLFSSWLLYTIFINSSPPGQNGRHSADDTFWWIFGNEKFCILIKISLKFVPKGPIDNNRTLV